jgi:hypothetical protein
LHRGGFFRGRTECAGECDLSICEYVFALLGGSASSVDAVIDFDVEYGELYEVRDGRECIEWGAPEHRTCDVARLERQWVDEVNGIADTSAYRQGTNVG